MWVSRVAPMANEYSALVSLNRNTLQRIMDDIADKKSAQYMVLSAIWRLVRVFSLLKTQMSRLTHSIITQKEISIGNNASARISEERMGGI
jgi:hypothetical protein